MAGKAFTLVEISRLCRVNLKTVLEWIDQGKLHAFKSPAGHRRVMKPDLLSFLIEYNLTIPSIFQKKHQRILSVEDDPHILKGLTRLIRRMGPVFELGTATNGLEANKKLDVFQPDLVILDIGLPLLDGFQVCETIRQRSRLKKTKILALTAQSDEETRQAMLRCGADDFLGKPFDIPDLTQKVCRLLHVRKDEILSQL